MDSPIVGASYMPDPENARRELVHAVAEAQKLLELHGIDSSALSMSPLETLSVAAQIQTYS